MLAFLKKKLRTVTINLWKPEIPVSTVSKLQKFRSLFVNMNSVILGFSGFSKYIVFLLNF